jgi:hypothetical protein
LCQHRAQKALSSDSYISNWPIYIPPCVAPYSQTQTPRCSVADLALPVRVRVEVGRAAIALEVRRDALALRERGEPRLQARRAVERGRLERGERLDDVEERVLGEARLASGVSRTRRDSEEWKDSYVGALDERRRVGGGEAVEQVLVLSADGYR